MERIRAQCGNVVGDVPCVSRGSSMVLDWSSVIGVSGMQVAE